MSVAAPTPVVLDDVKFAYLVPRERFIYKVSGKWKLDALVGKEGIRHVLQDLGNDLPTTATILRQRTYLRVYGAEMIPKAPAVFTNPEGRLFINTWEPPILQPIEGQYPRIERVINFLTNGDEAGANWLIQWMAAKVQSPTFVPKVAIVFSTEQGGGKGTLAFVMRQILGPGNCAVVKPGELGNRFNKRWVDKLFALGDELFARDDVDVVAEKLKVLIDGDELELEAKGVDQVAVRNRLAWMIASNNKVAPILVERHDRRYTVFANHDKLDPDYQAMLVGCFEADRMTPTPDFSKEIAAFWFDLLKVQVDRLLITRPYENEARANLIEASLSGMELFLKHVGEHGVNDLVTATLENGGWQLASSRKEWDFGKDGMATEVLFKCYEKFCKDAGARPLKRNRFGVALQNNRPKWEKTRNTAPSGRRVQCNVVPPTTALS